MIKLFENTYINQWRKFLLQCNTLTLQHYVDTWSTESNKSEITKELLSFVRGLLHDINIRLPGAKIPYEFDIGNYKLVT